MNGRMNGLMGEWVNGPVTRTFTSLLNSEQTQSALYLSPLPLLTSDPTAVQNTTENWIGWIDGWMDGWMDMTHRSLKKCQ